MTTSSASQPQANMYCNLIGARTCYLEFRSFLRAHNLVLERRITWNRTWVDDSLNDIFSMVRPEDFIPLVVEEYVQLTIPEGHHQIPGPPRTTSEDGDPVNEELLRDEEEVIEALRLLLGLVITMNTVTVQHFWFVLTSLRDKLRELPPHEVPNGVAYARILLRLVDRLMSFPSEEKWEFIEEDPPLYLSRRNYDECLGNLIDEMAQGFVWMRQEGTEEVVYVRNKELHAEYLRYLASHLSRA